MSNRNELTAYAGIFVCILGIFVIDLMTPLGFADWLLYLLPLLLSFRVREPLAPLITAAAIGFALAGGNDLGQGGCIRAPYRDALQPLGGTLINDSSPHTEL